jgi:hypothetical protein
LTATLLIAALSPAVASAAGNDGQQFFEHKIRPVLVEHCYSCHSVAAREAKKLQAELYLDSAAGVAAGGESGPVIVKGKSAESSLLKALKYEGFEMPPAGKLPEHVIADFAKWIDMGAPDPREGAAPATTKREINIAEGKKWWSFQPLSRVKPPDAARPVDGFLDAARRTRGLKANHPTTKEKLIRRAYYDLVGLPPTPEQIAAFVADPSPKAFEKVIDELLASPGYGERWARHWLDAARFAESGGYEFDGFRPGAYHYRDWVIRALNDDMPYDRFVRMQLAGDLLEPGGYQAAAASGFLVAGPYPGQITAKTVERIRYDQLDDMLMTIGGSMMGLTLGCVRCHEHKYDPIPQQDYYALAASLAKTVHGAQTMDVDPAATERARAKHDAEHKPLVAALETFAEKELPKRFEAWSKAELPKLPEATRWQALEPVAMEAGRTYLKETAGQIIAHDGNQSSTASVPQRGRLNKVDRNEVYRLTFRTNQKNLQALRLDLFTHKSLPQRGPGLNNDGSFQMAEITLAAKPIDRQAKQQPEKVGLKPVFAAFEDKDLGLKNAVDGKDATAWTVKTTAKKDNAAILEFEKPVAGFDGGTELTLELRFREAGVGRFRVALSVEPNPATWAGDVAPQHVTELRTAAALGNKLPASTRVALAYWFAPYDADTAQVVKTVREHQAAAPRPNLTEVYTTVAGGQDVFLLRRGEVDNKLGEAEPGFVQVLLRKSSASTEPTRSAAPAAAQSDAVDPRVSLAAWMTDVEGGAGPLVARVIANRIWQHHFGEGIVGTPNDFGVQGERPTHPELLEYLAQELVRSGWRLKALHKTIMLSEAYRASHEVDPANLKIDPQNRYLWHFRPRRLEAETIRDALLAVGGNLDAKMYGPSVLDDSRRRSVYLRVKRSELIPSMTMFDAPEPTQSIGERSVTTVPTQALAMMNSPFVRTQAEKLRDRIRPKPSEPLAAAIDRGYTIALGRTPTDGERKQMVAFVEEQRKAFSGDTAGKGPQAADAALVEFCQVLLCLNEFVYVD